MTSGLNGKVVMLITTLEYSINLKIEVFVVYKIFSNYSFLASSTGVLGFPSNSE
jgi:hypothetical protein